MHRVKTIRVREPVSDARDPGTAAHQPIWLGPQFQHDIRPSGGHAVAQDGEGAVRAGADGRAGRRGRGRSLHAHRVDARTAHDAAVTAAAAAATGQSQSSGQAAGEGRDRIEHLCTNTHKTLM